MCIDPTIVGLQSIGCYMYGKNKIKEYMSNFKQVFFLSFFLLLLPQGDLSLLKLEIILISFSFSTLVLSYLEP